MTLLRNTALAAGLLLGASCAPDPPADPVAEVLALAPRPVYGRLIGAASYGECSTQEIPNRVLPLIRCPRPILDPNSTLRRRLLDSSGSHGERARALWHLVWGESPAALDEGIERLERLARSAPSSAEAWNDLSVAYLERGLQRDAVLDPLHALHAHTRISQQTPETLFNRAVLLEMLGLHRLALQALGEALRAEADPSWRDEVQARQASLRALDRLRVPAPQLEPLAVKLVEVRRLLKLHKIEEVRERVLHLRNTIEAGTREDFELQLAECEIDYHEGRYGDLLARLDILEKTSSEDPALMARVERWRGLVSGIGGRYFTALEHYASSRRLFEMVGDRSSDLGVCRLEAEMLFILGDLDATWRVLLPCLRDRTGQSLEAEYAMLEIASMALPLEVRPGVEDLLATELVRLASQAENPVYHSSALIAQSRAMLDESASDAQGVLVEAARVIGLIEHEQTRASKEIDLALAQAEATAGEDAVAGVVAYQALLRGLEETNYTAAMPGALVAKGRLLRSLERLDEARQDLDLAISHLAAMAGLRTPGPLDAAFAEQVRAVYQQRIAVGLDLDESPAALFLLAEQARRLLLRGGFVGIPRIPRVPEGTAVVAFFMLPDRVLVWLADSEGLELRQSSLADSDLVQGLDDWTDAAREGASEIEEQSDRMADLLFGDMEQRILRQQRVVFVPDGALYRAPFSALRVGSPSRWLLEDLEVVVSPAVSLLTTRVPDRQPVGSVLIVAADEPGARHLPRLPQVAAEADAVAAAWQQKTILLAGRGATPSRVTSLAPASDIIHIAAHGQGHPNAPFTSSLALAADTGSGDSDLPITEILRWNLARTRFAFLSACRTAQGGSTGATGGISLASGFLMAGVPETVATLWEVRDDLAADFARRFYTRMSAGAPPVEALRSTQLELIGAEKEGTTVGTWAAYQQLQLYY